MTALKLLIYWITFPLKLPILTLLQIYGEFSNPQIYNIKEIPKRKGFEKPDTPSIINHQWPEAGYPDHSASRTGECVDVGLIQKGELRVFVKNTGEITRGPHGVENGPPVSGDMVCGFLLGYTSPWSKDPKPAQYLEWLADWMIENNEGPTERMDCGYRRNPLLVGAQSLLPLALYKTAYNETGEERFLKAYRRLLWMGYGVLALVPTAYMHKYPEWVKKLLKFLKFKNPVHNIRSLYNDANCMRCLAVLIRQSKGMSQFYWRLCALVVWFGSRRWHLPFMDFYGLGKVRESTKDYVSWMLEGEKRYDKTMAIAPVRYPKWGESWDDERYDNSIVYNVKTIGIYFDWFYATRGDTDA